MTNNQENIEELLVKGLSNMLKRTIEVNPGDKLAIAQEYKEWISCIKGNEFSKQEILIIDKHTFS